MPSLNALRKFSCPLNLRPHFTGLLVTLALGFASPAAAQQAVPSQSFVREDLASNAIRLEEQVRKLTPAPAARTAGDLRAAAAQAARRNDMRSALNIIGGATSAAPREALNWLTYARYSGALATQDTNNAWRHVQNALAAAYLAYQRATSRTEQAAALSLIASLHNGQSQYRLALNAYRASLDIVDDARVRATYEKLREEQGFRIVDYKVDSDSASPRVCFRFSEPLARGKVDFAPFVAVAGAANGAISTEDQQLCVEGLRHGERYAMVVRQGLPSSVGENLLKSVDYEIYVRDRSPRVRFTGKNYVLPSIGQDGIPVVSVNTERVAIDVMRIGDRSLLPTVRSSNFLGQIAGYNARQIIEESGARIWSGALGVRPELNRDVITAFPAAEAIGKLQPGVYVMIARPGEKPVSQTLLAENGDSYEDLATQWFVVSDIGLTAFSSENGVHVFVRSLATAQAVPGVELRLVARNNEVLSTQTTGADGHVRFDPGLSRGVGGMAPGLIVALKADDYGFLDLVQNPFDLTDRGVNGRKAPGALDAYVYPERGVYRSGETVNVTALLRNAQGVAVPHLPMTLVVKRPDGVEYRRERVGDQGVGGRAYSFPLLPGAATGAWRLQAFADPGRPPIGEASFLVEDYVPERLDVVLSPQDKLLAPANPSRVDLSARYLYGAPGAGLEVSGEIIISAAANLSIPGLENYAAGLMDEPFETVRTDIEAAAMTGPDGRATIEIPIPEIETSRPLEGKIILRAGEPGGRAVERVLTLPIRPRNGVIAVRRNFADLGEGAVANFDIVTASPDGLRVPARNLSWSLYRVTNAYQWYNSDGRWGFERVKSSRRLADGRLDVTATEAARITAQVTSGTHRLEIKSDDGALAPTSISFNVGWSGDATAETPDLLDVNLDKEAYRAGEDMKFRIVSRFDGRANIAIVSDRLHEFREVDLKVGDNEVSLPVKVEYGSGAYAVAFAHRPLDQQARRMPGRSLGLAWFDIDRESRRLSVDLGAPDKIAPRSALTIPVRVAGLNPGEEAYVTLAAVDVGILALTRHEPPNATSYFFGRKQLGVEIRDLYGLLIDGMQGSRGAIRSGGDGAGGSPEGNRPTQAPLALYSGLVKVGPDGVASINFDIPAFNGSMRVMAVAWTSTKVGQASKDIVVRDPVVVQATLPRFMNYGDVSRLHVQIENVEGQGGDYILSLAAQGGIVLAESAKRHTLRLEKGARTQVSIEFRGGGLGESALDLRLMGQGLDVAQSFALNVKPGSGRIHRRFVRSIGTGQSLQISRDLLADFLPGTGTVSVAASPYGGIDVASLLGALDRYPYGCSEQTVSRAMPLLYVDKLANRQALSLDSDAQRRIRESIERVLSRQDSSGAFGLWSSEGAGGDLWLDAFVSDFLTRAREAGYVVPQKSFDQALDRLRNQVVNVGEVKEEQGPSIAYAIYVLARNGRPVMGDLRYLTDTKLASFESALSRAQLGAALALLGDRSRARSVFAAAATTLSQAQPTRFSRSDYGTRLRDAAGLMALVAEADGDRSVISLAGSVLQQDRAATSVLSTQEMNWMVLAATAVSAEARDMQLTVGGEPHAGALYRSWRGNALDAGAVPIANPGSAPAQIVLTTSGSPVQPESPVTQGYQIERSFYMLDGKPKNMAAIRQNDRFVIVLKVTELEAAYGRLLLVDHLPAGLEIDNPKLFEGGSVEALSFVKPGVPPTYSEYRDDQFVAAFERDGRERATFNVAYLVRAVTPGRYLYPPATIEDMYRPDRFGRTGTGSIEVTELRR